MTQDSKTQANEVGEVVRVSSPVRGSGLSEEERLLVDNARVQPCSIGENGIVGLIDIIDRLRLASPAPDGWEDIASAPKDGTTLILAIDYGGECRSVLVGSWRQHMPGEFDWLVHNSFHRFSGKPTHWMPLPLPPREK